MLGLDTSEGVVERDLPMLVHGLEWVSGLIDLIAIAILLVGTVRFVIAFVRSEMASGTTARRESQNRARIELGRYILSGLELLIVTDIIHTALSLELGDLVFLGLLVAIRVAIGYFLDREIRELKEETPDA